MHREVGDHISCTTGWVREEADKCVDRLLLKLGVGTNNRDTSLLDKLHDLLVGLGWVLFEFLESSYVDKVRDHEKLARSVTKGIESAHETKDWLQLALGKLPVLTE